VHAVVEDIALVDGTGEEIILKIERRKKISEPKKSTPQKY